MKIVWNCWLVLLMLIAARTSQAQLVQGDVPDPDPRIEQASFHLDPNFQINLFARDPMVEKPIQMNWDNRGRLWCGTSQTYPQLVPGQVPNDKIFILEDTSGSGKADKSTVFADGLFIPNSVIPGDGGAYVTNSTEILHLKENPANHKAVGKRVVLAGFGTEDTHHIVHGLTWGPDGRLYFLQSIYIHSHLETPRGLKSLLGSGVWRFDTRTLDLNVYSRGLVNPWGIVWDRWGQTFQTDGAGGQGINFAFPGVGFESAVGLEKIMPGLNPGSPKYCSEEILSGRNVPDGYQGDILTNDFRANRIVRFKLSDNGAGFASKQMSDFLTSSDSAFRPVDIKMGSDGAIYIADWYNPIIQHGEVDFRDQRRDHVHGRIWRVTAKGRPLVPKIDIAGATIPQLLELLKEPEDYTRRQARLTLRERDPKEVSAALQRWVGKLKGDDAQVEHDRLEALWVCENINVINEELLAGVLRSSEPRARAAGVRVVGDWAQQLADPIALLQPMTGDPFPRVRLEAVRALAAVRSPTSVVVATRVLDQPMDPVLDYALWLTCNELSPVWMLAFQSGKLSEWGKAEHLNYALAAVKSPIALATLIEQLKSGRAPPESRPGISDLISNIGGVGEANTLLDRALAPDGDEPTLRSELLTALERMNQRHQVRPSEQPERIQNLFSRSNVMVRRQAIALAGQWKLQELRPQLEAFAQNTKEQPPEIYSQAMQSLALLGGEQSAALLRKMSEADQPPAVRQAAVAALASVDLKDAASRAAQLLVSGKVEPDTLINAFSGREGGSDALAEALKQKRLPPDTAKLALRALHAIGAPESELSKVLSGAANISTEPLRLNADQMKQMIADVAAHGDAGRGEEVFRRGDTGCYQCHSIAGAGGWLAPDLSSIGASSPMDYLIDSVLDPNKAIKDGYQGYTIATTSGEVYSGIKVRQDNNQIVLRDNTHFEIPIALSQIRAQKEIGSLMPTGLASGLTHEEFLDLIRFLSELGKPGPFASSTKQYIRRWRVASPAPDGLEAGKPIDATTEATLSRVTWEPAYTRLSGVLPMSLLSGRGHAEGCARGEIDVISPGKIRLTVDAPFGTAVWLDQKPIASGPNDLDLSRGLHVVTVKGASGDLRVEVADVPGSTARARPIGGK